MDIDVYRNALTEHVLKKGLLDIRALNGGVQVLFRFDNKWGASVVRSSYSYGGDEGLWEVGVIRWYSDSRWELVHGAEVAPDDEVVGWLDEDGVTAALLKIAGWQR